MPDAESFPQRLVESYLPVQILDLGNKLIQSFIVQAILILDKAFRIKARFHLKEAKAATKRIVDHATTILCILLLSLYLLLAVFWIIRSIIDVIDDRKRDKRNAAWEAERQQMEKERAMREVEYHEARMKELDKQ